MVKKHLKQIPKIMGSMAMGGMIGGMGAMAYSKMGAGGTNPMSGATEMMPALGSVAMMQPMMGMMGGAMKSLPKMKMMRRR